MVRFVAVFIVCCVWLRMIALQVGCLTIWCCFFRGMLGVGGGRGWLRVSSTLLNTSHVVSSRNRDAENKVKQIKKKKSEDTPWDCMLRGSTEYAGVCDTKRCTRGRLVLARNKTMSSSTCGVCVCLVGFFALSFFSLFSCLFVLFARLFGRFSPNQTWKLMEVPKSIKVSRPTTCFTACTTSGGLRKVRYVPRGLYVGWAAATCHFAGSRSLN